MTLIDTDQYPNMIEKLTITLVLATLAAKSQSAKTEVV